MDTILSNSDDFLPWVEKYRPKTIDEIISHAQNIETIKKLLIGGSLPHLLFHGTSGTGKTSTIMALAKELYKNNITKNNIIFMTYFMNYILITAVNF